MALGGEVQVPTLNGRDELSIPSGTQPGARFRVRGKGMPNVSGRGHGRPARHRTRRGAEEAEQEQRQIFEELGRTMPERTDGDGSESAEKPFFERVKDIFG
jgi:molecular chaperone DnaJ